MHRKTLALILAAALISAFQVRAKPSEVDKYCSIEKCPAGTKVLSILKPGENYYACQTREISDYTNITLGLIQISYLLGGTLPNISPVTGEPEYQGKTAELIRVLRINAGVETFDQAVARCQDGKRGQKLIVSNFPDKGLSVWVFVDGRPEVSFWMPSAHLSVRR